MSEISDWHWRNSMRPTRFFAFDSRAVVAVILVMAHARLWTFVLAILVNLAFWFAERAGYSFESTLRRMRSFVTGPKRPAVFLGSKRQFKDYGR